MLDPELKPIGNENTSFDKEFSQENHTNLETKDQTKELGQSTEQTGSKIDLAPDLEQVLHSPAGQKEATVPSAPEVEDDHVQLEAGKSLRAHNLEALLADSGEEVVNEAWDLTNKANALSQNKDIME